MFADSAGGPFEHHNEPRRIAIPTGRFASGNGLGEASRSEYDGFGVHHRIASVGVGTHWPELFRRLMNKVDLDEGRSFYSLRKTGATLIEQIDPSATEMYLAHAERGMKRNYAERNREALGRALGSLEKKLQLPVFPAYWPSGFSHKHWIRFPRGGHRTALRHSQSCNQTIRSRNVVMQDLTL